MIETQIDASEERSRQCGVSFGACWSAGRKAHCWFRWRCLGHCCTDAGARGGGAGAGGSPGAVLPINAAASGAGIDGDRAPEKLGVVLRAVRDPSWSSWSSSSRPSWRMSWSSASNCWGRTGWRRGSSGRQEQVIEGLLAGAAGGELKAAEGWRFVRHARCGAAGGRGRARGADESACWG